MKPSSQTLVELETRFWQSIVDQDTDAALALLCEPAFMVGSHGMASFDHDGYRRMAEHGTMVLKAFELSDIELVFPRDDTAVLTYRVKQTLAPRGGTAPRVQQMADSSTWVRSGGHWRCAIHTETPIEPAPGSGPGAGFSPPSRPPAAGRPGPSSPRA
jgi:hypothetical protein